MKYSVNINKKTSYIKVYTVKKRIKGDTNAVSKFVQSLIDKYITKGKREVQ